MNGWKFPLVKSLNCDAAALRRSIDLGSKTISGFLAGFFICHRSKWKKDAAEEGWATVILFSAQSVKNLSILPEE